MKISPNTDMHIDVRAIGREGAPLAVIDNLVSGTTVTLPDGTIDGIGDAAAQAWRCLANIESALNALGAGIGNVVRTRIYVTDISNWESVGRVHGQFFADVLPVTAMVEVSRLIDDDLLVEIEAEAVITKS
jgi:enamine deaminase RidA (YjgF/YER057c/UK114 family)